MSDGNSDKKPIFKKVLNAAEKAFKKLHELGTYKPKDLAKVKEYKSLINETANVFKLGISQEVPEEMKAYLEKDVFVFSGLKTHAQLAEARNLLKDSEGNIRPYHQFEQDVLKLNEKYNQNYLEAEWQFAQSSSQSAANWANLSDSERYNLQYRTAGDEKVRESHASINGTTLPKSSEFWISYYPPNGWRCRCIVVLVLASKYPATDVDKATAAAEKATTQIGKNGKNKLEMFRFNPGLEKLVFPKGNSYEKVVESEKAKKIVKEEITEVEYKNYSLDKLKELYSNQIINQEKEKLIMNNGYVGTMNSFTINENIRKGIPLNERDKKTVDALDYLIKSNKLNDNVTLHRNVKIDFIKNTFGVDVDGLPISDAVSKIKEVGLSEILNNGFTSTSAIKDVNAFLSRKVNIEIRAKKGTNAFIPKNYSESEVILGRNQKFKILEIVESEDKNKIKILVETD